MWIKKVLSWLSLALLISLSQWTGACWEFALEPIKLPFILSGVCSPSEANYCSNPFKVFMILLNTIRNFSWEIFLGSSITVKFNEYLICFFQFCKGTVNFNYLFVVISSVKCGLFSAIDGQRWVLAYVSKIQAKYFDYLFNWANQLDNIFTRLLILFTLLSLFNFNIDRD